MVLDENVIRSTSNRNATRFGLTQLGEGEKEGKQMKMIPTTDSNGKSNKT